MTSTSSKYIGMDVHKESISIAVRNAVGKIVMECVIETKANMILQCIDGLRGDLHVTFEEGTSAAWLYDLLKPHVTELIVCDPRKNASMREDNQNDKIDARRLAELLRIDHLSPVYHGEHGLRTLKELVRSYLTVTKDLVRVKTRVKAIYRSWAIPCNGKEVYAACHRAEWLENEAVAGLTSRLTHAGLIMHSAQQQATARLYNLVITQAQALSYVEVYWLLAATSALMFLLCFVLARNEPGKGGQVAVH